VRAEVAAYPPEPVSVLAIILIVVAALAVFAIAAVVIGRESRRMDAIAPRSVYTLDEAVEYVADHLPPESQARLTPDEVAQLLRLHMAQLRDEGLQPPVAVDHVQDIDVPVVVDETNAAGYLIGEAERAGLDVEDIDVVNVVDAHLEYFDAIGAVGPPAEGIDDGVTGDPRRGNGHAD
jgi:hypothetical protein